MAALEEIEMPKLSLMFGDKIVKEVPVGNRPVTIGRSPDNDLPVDNLAVSNHHAKVYFEAGRMVVEDLDSLNGTFVNDLRVERATLHDGDNIHIGKHKIKVDTSGDAPVPWDTGRKTAAPRIDETMVLDTKERRQMLQQAAAMGESMQFASTRVHPPAGLVQATDGRADQSTRRRLLSRSRRQGAERERPAHSRPRAAERRRSHRSLGRPAELHFPRVAFRSAMAAPKSRPAVGRRLHHDPQVAAAFSAAAGAVPRCLRSPLLPNRRPNWMQTRLCLMTECVHRMGDYGRPPERIELPIGYTGQDLYCDAAGFCDRGKRSRKDLLSFGMKLGGLPHTLQASEDRTQRNVRGNLIRNWAQVKQAGEGTALRRGERKN